MPENTGREKGMHRVIFNIGPFTLYSYGLFVAIAFVAATVLIVRDARKFNLSRDDAFDCVILMFAGSLIGARVLFVIINWEYFLSNFAGIFRVYEGGLAFQGGLIGGAIAVIATSVIKKLPLRKIGDLLAPYIALGQSIGRIGCFLNGCCYGRAISSGLGVTFPKETVMRIPVQIYSSLALLAVFVILIIIREKRRFDGAVFSVYLVLYGILRFFMDFARGDDLASFFGITLSQAIGIGTFFFGAILYAAFSQMKNR